MNTIRFCGLLTVSAMVCLLDAIAVAEDKLDYNRDVRPILSDNCFHCHGFDEKHRAADLRLDTRDGATTDLDGHAAIVPGKPEASELVARIDSEDEDLVMPPKDARRVLSEQQKEILRRWIQQGAAYDKHWAFRTPAKPSAPPAPTLSGSAAIDGFIETELAAKQWSASTRSKPEKWLRRVWFDLVGIAPPPAEVDVFLEAVHEYGEKAYSDAVDALLESPRFGERMAQDWLDAARYADTHGFNNDSQRNMWRWRDWVIAAFNDNLPYDRFLTKQLAGDLLPNPSLEDLIATGFCRNHVINSEGGIIDEEYRVEYVVDRVRTLGTGILGLTLECSRCHDHKFDPITQKDFYRLFAFFNQVSEIGEDGRVANAVPMIAAPTAAEQTSLKQLEEKAEATTSRMEAIVTAVHAKLAEEKTSVGEAATPKSVGRPVGSLAGGEYRLKLDGKIQIERTPFGQAYSTLGPTSTIDWDLSKEVSDLGKPWTFSMWFKWDGKPAVLASSMRLNVDPSAAGYGSGLGIEVDQQGCVEVKLARRWPAYAVYIVTESSLIKNAWTQIVVTHDGTVSAGGLSIYVDGESLRSVTRTDGSDRRGSGVSGGQFKLGRHESKAPDATPLTFAAPKLIGKVVPEADIRLEADRLRFQYLKAQAKRTPAQDRELLKLYLSIDDSSLFNADYAKLRSERQAVEQQRRALMRSVTTTMVMQDQPTRRETFVLTRGQYNAHGDNVEPGVPEELLLPWPEGAPKNRLGLAKWLTHPDHPLTARVAVNRIWQQLFGVGLVKSAEDFGMQGEYPSHPKLLDWLARDFVTSGWNVKRMLKQLVLTDSYRRDSRVGSGMYAADPENRWLARGPRFRLPAENIRDHLLDVGGLLKHRTGGPSVYPKQPADLYEGIVVDAAYPGTKWLESKDDDLCRRSIYTFWKRTVPYPVLTVFDAPDREVCVARRSKTNTPLQALTLMNEPSMMDAARGLANRMRDAGDASRADDPGAGLAFGFRLATGRLPNQVELEELCRLNQKMRADFTDEPTQALMLLGEKTEGNGHIPEDVAERAAYVAMSSVILNLDESITKD